MRFLLDTDTCIALIKRKPAPILRRLAALAPGEAGISAITLAELRYGVAKSADREKNGRALDEFLLPLEVAGFDEPAAEAYGAVRAALERAGTPIVPLDTQIGAQALSLGTALVTHNVREFRRIPGLTPLENKEPKALASGSSSYTIVYSTRPTDSYKTFSHAQPFDSLSSYRQSPL